MIDSIYNYCLKIKAGTEYLSYGRHIIRDWLNESGARDIVDLGCGAGDDLSTMKYKATLHGAESNAYYRSMAERKGINTFAINIEHDPIPFRDGTVDVVLMNQVLEHTKEIFFIFSEVSRILRPGGLFLIGVPNLAAWHDRALLMLGRQPSGMRVLGPHVRGFTIPGLKAFAECDEFFELEEWRGSGFYPFPKFVAQSLASLFPSAATSFFFKLRRTNKERKFIDVLNSRRFETNYFGG